MGINIPVESLEHRFQIGDNSTDILFEQWIIIGNLLDKLQTVDVNNLFRTDIETSNITQPDDQILDHLFQFADIFQGLILIYIGNELGVISLYEDCDQI